MNAAFDWQTKSTEGILERYHAVIEQDQIGLDSSARWWSGQWAGSPGGAAGSPGRGGYYYKITLWKKVNHSVSDNLKSRDASASKNSNKPITNLSTNCLRFVLVFPFSRKIWKKRVWKIGEKLSLSDSTVQYKAFNMIISSCAGARTSVWPSDAPCLGETRPCHSSSRLSVSTAINYHSTRLS